MTDIYNKPVILTSGEEQECLGSVILASVAVGLYKDATEACKRMISIVERLEPIKENNNKYERLLKIYISLYEKLKESFSLLAD